MRGTLQSSHSRLPAAVFDLALRLGVDRAGSPRDIRLTQKGRLKSNLASSKWMTFTAALGLITGRDALSEGEGRFDIKALGLIPIARAVEWEIDGRAIHYWQCHIETWHT